MMMLYSIIDKWRMENMSMGKRVACSLKAIGFISLVLFFSASAFAQVPIELEDEIQVSSLVVHAQPESPAVSDKAVIDIHLGVKVWTLLGEPVFMCSGWWKIQSLTVQGEVFFADGSYNRGLPRDVLSKVHIWDSTFQIPIRSSGNGNDINLRCSAGEFWAAGERRASFNIPDSVGWDKLFYTSFVNGFGSQSLSAERAKSVMTTQGTDILINQGTFNHSNVLQLKIDLSSVYRWMEGEQAQQIEEQELKANVLKRTSPTSLDDMFDAVDAAVVAKEIKEEVEAQADSRDEYYSQSARGREEYRNKIKRKRCGELATKSSQASPLEYIGAQAKAVHECLAVRNLTAKKGENSLWGYVRDSGEWHIKPIYQSVTEFVDGTAIVHKGSRERGKDKKEQRYYPNWRSGIVDMQGNIIIPFEWNLLSRIDGNRFVAETMVVEQQIGTELRGAPPCGKKKKYYPRFERSWETGIIGLDNKWIGVPEKHTETYVAAPVTICLNRS